MKLDSWATETYRDFYAMSFRIKKTLFSGKSDFQNVDVVETEGHGKMLFNDGLAMVSERDEFVYHDMITHVPLFVHPNPKKVLVIGGGDGGTAREVLRHSSVEQCVMVEIDEMVVAACKEHIPQTSSVFSNPKLNLIIDDAVKFVAETQETFDVILVDSTDPIGPAQPLFGVDFYQNVAKCLNPGGVVVSQGESPFFETTMQNKLLSVLGEVFPVVKIYNFHNITYPGGFWSFTFASQGLHPLKDFKEERVEQSGLEFQYYNAETHRAAFALPEFMKRNVKGLIKEG
ncbi:MAG: polyamine aminopropyltransferase [Bdellovibrionales bacterium]|nr:polyamine aminopropyltransferase [Bdellovibrionales bacterium]